MEIIRGCPSTMMDDYQLNVSTMIRHTVRNFPEREIVYRTPDGVFRYTYEDAYQRMKRLANALKKLGVEPGDRVGVLDWNTRRQYELYYAVPGSGAVFLQLNIRLSSPDIAYVANHSGAKVIFVDESLLSLAETIASDLKTVKLYVVMTDKKLTDIETKLDPVLSYEDLLNEASAAYEWPVIEERSAYGACYTSGTTGKPKGVYYSQRSIYIHTLMYTIYGEFDCYDCLLQIVPMFHAQGWGHFQCATFVGAKLVLPGRYTMENIGDLVDLMIKEKVTVANGAPTILIPMLSYVRALPEKPDFQGLRFLCGATEPPLFMMKGFKELTGADFVHIYGATEASPLITKNILKPSLSNTLSEEEKWELKKKQGLPVPGIDLKITDPEGKEVPHDGVSVGEIFVRGPWITGSYFNDERSKECFINGYWKSADSGSMDTEGFLKIVDRSKDLIKSGGEWISSVDLENAIMAHPGVVEASVVGIPHPKWEERPLALVMVSETSRGKISEQEILEFIEPKFAKWQLPNQVVFVDEIPKTSVGKFNKVEIRERYKYHYTEK